MMKYLQRGLVTKTKIALGINSNMIYNEKPPAKLVAFLYVILNFLH